ncbi:nuclear transcription factor Y subunit gamma [Telopea speciosissima]|uniref:nuclear transcription factor Y subunit gamma n=1 Tax=Telopea speciosissima TaxID=54955 RepID=UPI001CC73206|nr:nuclear transcription factor Y subunit gamma [Telopea speciosissima]
MAEEENTETLGPEFPLGRVKKIMMLDRDIKKVSSEALHLISLSTDLFLGFLAEKSAEIAVEKKRKTVKLEHIRMATKRHRPTNDFLIDSLPMPSKTSNNQSSIAQARSGPTAVEKEKPLPVGTRRIDDFFRKSSNEIPNLSD